MYQLKITQILTSIWHHYVKHFTMLCFIDKWHVMSQESQKSCQYSYPNAPDIVPKNPWKNLIFLLSSILLLPTLSHCFLVSEISFFSSVLHLNNEIIPRKWIIWTNCLHFPVHLLSHMYRFIYKNSQVGTLQENSNFYRCQVYKCNQSNACSTMHLDTCVVEYGSPNCRLPT